MDILASETDALIQAHLDQDAASGAAVALLKDGDIAYLGGFGTTSVDVNGVTVTPLTLWSCDA
jgi:CubicO group peptidase (beta-lactamase class C family)